jgi:ParB family transcriptional regulator, chromosome partitioning protein
MSRLSKAEEREHRMAAKRNGLGRGLEALIKDGSTAAKLATQKDPLAEKQQGGVLELALGDIVAGALQPRQAFDDETLGELTKSIEEHGILQPLLVRKKGSSYEIIAGERRFRAAKQAGLKKVPVLIWEVEDEKALEMALIENLQRQDLNPIEEAEGYALLQRSFGLTQADVAKKVGKARASIANALRLLELPQPLREFLSAGKLSVGHAKVLLGSENVARMLELATLTIEQGWSVRMLEAHMKPAPKTEKTTASPDLHLKEVKALRQELSHFLGTVVRIKPSKTGADGQTETGAIQIEFKNKDELDRLLQLIRK